MSDVRRWELLRQSLREAGERAQDFVATVGGDANCRHSLFLISPALAIDIGHKNAEPFWLISVKYSYGSGAWANQ
jgi:hypothetical protein